MIRLLAGDCRDVLATLPAESVQCVVTSPPYYGLRDYGTVLWDGGDADCGHVAPQGGPSGKQERSAGTRLIQYRDTCGKCGAVRVDRQIGLEATPDEYLATMVAVFREVRRVLRGDGTCWVNMGDSYATSPAGNFGKGKRGVGPFDDYRSNISMDTTRFAKPKDLLLMPARLALALRADGWWVRSDIIWAKPNPMPESVTDRPASAHEHVFLLTKSARYYYDADAVREEPTGRTDMSRVFHTPLDGERVMREYPKDGLVGRNLRNVWTIATSPFSAAHFATFPPELAERCIKAGTRPGDTVLDPFAGAGTTALVADRLQRDCIGIDLNTAYTEMAMERVRADAPLLAELGPVPEHPVETEIADLFQDMAAD